MTVIAVHRDRQRGIVRMYSDKRISSSDGTYVTIPSKLWEYRGTLYGFAGDMPYINMVKNLISEHGLSPHVALVAAYGQCRELTDDGPGIEGVAATPDGSLYEFGTMGYCSELEDDFHAVGSGGQIVKACWMLGNGEKRKDPHRLIVASFGIAAKLRVDVDGCTWEDVVLQ